MRVRHVAVAPLILCLGVAAPIVATSAAPKGPLVVHDDFAAARADAAARGVPVLADFYTDW